MEVQGQTAAKTLITQLYFDLLTNKQWLAGFKTLYNLIYFYQYNNNFHEVHFLEIDHK